MSLYFGAAPIGIASFRKSKRRIIDESILGEVLRLYFEERLAMRQIADMLGVSHMTIYRAMNDPRLEILI